MARDPAAAGQNTTTMPYLSLMKARA